MDTNISSKKILRKQTYLSRIPGMFKGMLFFLIVLIIFSKSGLAQDFKNVSLLDQWRTDTLLSAQNIFFNEVWHFDRNGRDYAVIGSTEGTHFFEITPNDNFRFISFISGDFRSAQVHNRDFRDFGNYIYVVADQGSASALQILNISMLPDSVFLEKTDTSNWNRAHTICIDKESELLYACTYRPPLGHPEWIYSPLKVFSLADPLNPALVFSGFENIDEVHYAYVRGDTAYLNCGFDGLKIYNFSNPSNPVLLGSLSVYNDQGYNHSGWLSEDGKTYFFTDESEGKRIKMVDVSNIANPIVVRNFGTENFQNAVAHHCIPVGNLLFTSYYNEGLRIFDTRPPVREIAYYDTYSLTSDYFMNGAWGVFPFRNGQRILVSDRTFGLFLFGFNYDVFSQPKQEGRFSIFPNPIAQGEKFIVSIEDSEIRNFTIEILDNSGKLIHEVKIENQTYAEIKTHLSQGVYHVKITYKDYLNEAKKFYEKLLVVSE